MEQRWGGDGGGRWVAGKGGESVRKKLGQPIFINVAATLLLQATHLLEALGWE